MATTEFDRLEKIRAKLTGQIQEKQAEVIELKKKFAAVEQVIDMLFREETEKPQANKVVEIRRDKYKDMSIGEAVLDCINHGPSRSWSRPEVQKFLKDNGFRSKAKSPYALVAGTLQRLEKSEKIGSIPTPQGKRFKKVEQLADETDVSKQTATQ